MNLMEFQLRRLQAITDGEGNHMKYVHAGGAVHPIALFRAKIGCSKRHLNSIYMWS
jgi:hypothetical protein